jgi:hypothetical protein
MRIAAPRIHLKNDKLRIFAMYHLKIGRRSVGLEGGLGGKSS